jgi:hypothetical protein
MDSKTKIPPLGVRGLGVADGLIHQAKFEINLVEYVKQYGYEVNRQKSSATDVILQKKEGDLTLDTIGVRYYPATGYKYWTAMDSSDKGSLIDFEINKNRLDFNSPEGKRELFAKIDEFLGNVNQMNFALKPAQIATEAVVQKQITEKELNFLPLTDTRYLEGRGITESAYRSPEFQGQVFNEQVILKGKTYMNTVFPIRNEEVLLAKIRRNDEEMGYRGGQFNQIQEKRANGIHVSNFPSGRLDKLYLIESPIDALSYFELKMKEIRAKNENVAFISTVGHPSNSAYNTIQKFINASEPKQLISLMDNDRAGKVFTINLIGRLSKPNTERRPQELSNHIKAEINVSQKTEATLSLYFSYDTDEKRQAMAESLKEKLLLPLQKNIAVGSDAQIEIITIAKTAHHAHLEVKFPYNHVNLSTVEQGLIQIKGLENQFLIEHPIQKDWNDELKRQKPYVVTIEKNGTELAQKRFESGIEAYDFIENRDLVQTRMMKLYHEKFNRSHEVDAPQLLLKIKYGEVLEMDGKLQTEIEKFKEEKALQARLEKEKVLALQISKGLFPKNELQILKTIHQAETQQHFIELGLVHHGKLICKEGIHPSFIEKINQNMVQSAVIVFNNKTDSVHLMIPELRESVVVERGWVEKINSLNEIKGVEMKNNFEMGGLV